MQRLHIATSTREQMLDITSQVAGVVAASGTREGVAVVFCPHTTASITINENADSDVVTDILATMGRLVPRAGGYRHSEGNSDAHVKASMFGSSVTIPVAEGRLQLGTWQGIYFAEFDGPRTRTAIVHVLGS